MHRSHRIIWSLVVLAGLLAAPAWGQDQDIYHFDDTDNDGEHWRILSWKNNLQIDYSDDYADVVRFFKDRSATFMGDLGVGGVTNPDRALHVNGYVKTRGLRGFTYLFYEDRTGSGGQWREAVVSNGRFQIDRTDAYGVDYLSLDYETREARSEVPWTFEKKVGVGTSTPDEKLSVDGNVLAREVIVEPDRLPDYVFSEGYDLPTLEEVSTFIDEEGHLPSVPSAEEVEKNGLHLGEMDATLLRKVEELTLYAIEQKRRADRQTARADSLAAEVRRLRGRDATQHRRLDALERQNERMRKRLNRLAKRLEDASSDER